MIDTVRFTLGASPLKSAFGWEMQEGTRLSPTEGRFVPYKLATNTETGLRIGSNDGFSSWMEVSLPRVVSGHNGRLLRPHEINMAYYAALDIASDVVEDLSLEKMTRMDLVHHFEGYACDFFDSLRGMRHSKVRKKQVEFLGTGLVWPGKDCHIRLYDKKAELENVAGAIQRLEFQLRGSALLDVWSSLGGFDPDSCYEYYKKLCNGFQGSRPVPRVGSLPELLCILQKHKFQVDGVDIVSRFINARSRSSQFRLRAEIQTVKIEYFHANFSEHLPASINDLRFLDCIPPADILEVA